MGEGEGMDKTKTREITVRVLAVAIALILWIYVTNEQNPEMQMEISSIPVKLVNVESLAQGGFVMLSDTNSYSIKLTIKGRGKDVLPLKPQDFKAEANLGGGYRVKGTNSILVELKDWPKNIEIPNQPVYISVELDELVQRNFPVNVQVQGVAKEGYSSLTPVVRPAEVILKGAAKYIGRVNSVVATVDIKDSYADFQTSMPVQILDKDGKAVPDIECTPKTVDISVPVKKAKEVLINIRRTGQLPAGVFLKGISVTPATVSITGDDRIVNGINSIDTVPVSLEGINANTIKSVGINLPTGVMLVGSNVQLVNVNIDVETTTSRTFNVPVSYTNLPGELTAELLTNNIDITLSGQESVLNKVAAGDLGAVINLKDTPVEDGEHEYTPKLTYPPGLDLKEIIPQKIKVKITKKQG